MGPSKYTVVEQKRVENKAKGCNFAGLLEPTPRQDVNELARSGMDDTGVRWFCQGKRQTGLQGFF